LAAISDTFMERVKEATEGTQLHTRDMLLALVIGLLVGGLLFIWVYLRHRKKVDKERSKEFSRFKPSSGGSSSTSEGGQRRRRRRRRPHRPRNPSLQQTGGLPAPRPDDELPNY